MKNNRENNEPRIMKERKSSSGSYIYKFNRNLNIRKAYEKGEQKKIDKRMKKALKAEEKIADILRNLDESLEVYTQKRIPYNDTTAEIDVILLTSKAVYMVEVKNWSGIVNLEDGVLTQKDKTETKPYDLDGLENVDQFKQVITSKELNIA